MRTKAHYSRGTTGKHWKWSPESRLRVRFRLWALRYWPEALRTLA